MVVSFEVQNDSKMLNEGTEDDREGEKVTSTGRRCSKDRGTKRETGRRYKKNEQLVGERMDLKTDQKESGEGGPVNNKVKPRDPRA
jgi:hypothetical protein